MNLLKELEKIADHAVYGDVILAAIDELKRLQNENKSLEYELFQHTRYGK